MYQDMSYLGLDRAPSGTRNSISCLGIGEQQAPASMQLLVSPRPFFHCASLCIIKHVISHGGG